MEPGVTSMVRGFLFMKVKIAQPYTQVPNEFIESMGQYKHTTVKVFLAICRKTIGWHKMSDRISHTQIQAMTNMDRNTVRNAINELVENDWILQTRTKQGYVYDINFIENTPNGVEDNGKGVKISPQGGLKIHPTKEKKEIYINIELAFRNAFKKTTGEEYRIQYAKDRKLLKPLITKYGEDKILSLIDEWFRDEFGEKCGYTIGGFSSCFNKLLMKSPQKTKEKDTRKALDKMESLRQDKKLHPEKYRRPE